MLKHLYYPDGDVALSISDGRGQHIFRVDRIFLSRHSSVFAGMFTLPFSSTCNELYDGVPLIRLVDDDVDGIIDLLQFMYDPS